MSKSAASESPESDRRFGEILKVRKVWWRVFFELSHAIDELEDSEGEAASRKRKEISQRMGRLIWVFNAACFRNASVLRHMPKVKTAGTRKPPAPATRRKLKLVPRRPA